MVHQLFEVAVLKYPEDTAIVHNDRSISFAELNEKADNLARAILQKAPQQEIIGISTSRCIEMVISILAILKAGKAYLPLDPNYPEQRLDQIITEAGIGTCLSTDLRRHLFEDLGLQVVLSDNIYSLPDQPLFSQSANACILYTSGSTGQPKGVCIGHTGLTEFLNWQITHALAGPGIRALQFCHLSFDVSMQEIFVPLISGATLYLIDDDDRLDGGRLLDFLIRNGISKAYFPYVTLQYLCDAASTENKFPIHLQEVFTAGELLKITPAIRKFFSSIQYCKFINAYGPTEATIWVTELHLNGDPTQWAPIPSIGTAIANCSIFILDDDMKMVDTDGVGDLYISGPCLANGYLHRPELTEQSFIKWTHPTLGVLSLYRSGDQGKQSANGEIEFLGRKDEQVKIRGNRVELAEIELAIAGQKDIQQTAVIVREDVPAQKKLVAYVVGHTQGDTNSLRTSLAALLPDYMVPDIVVWLDDLPKTSSGKIDKKAIPKPELKRPVLNTLYKHPKGQIEDHISAILIELFEYDKIGVDDNFFELGGNSLLAQRLVSELKYRHQYILPVTKLYQFPTIAGMAKYLKNEDIAPVRDKEESDQKPSSSSDIAIIGMAARFPGAESMEEFWDLLTKGKETTSFFRKDELDKSLSEDLINDPSYVKARGIVKDADQFDPSFFGINQKLAELMDPQQRVFLEISWEVLEKTGYLPQLCVCKTGIFAGVGTNTYYENNVLGHEALIDAIGKLQVNTVNEKDYIASRTAYHLDLTGPAVSVHSACSTSLLAVVEAVNSLRMGQCELAIAGGASITAPIHSGHIHQEGSMLSADGHCRPFDQSSTGTVFSDGAGVVLLKPLDTAERDGDIIYGVIKGVGVNNDGGSKGSFTAPSAAGQANAISTAIKESGIDPADISYVEAHGTGTPVGDPIEFEGLVTAFGQQSANQFCAIGSVKSNFGHLTQAAGVAGLIKTCLSLHHKKLPASLGYEQPNKHIDFSKSPFYVNDKLKEWDIVKKRIAGVSSFGVGGTNVHVIVEEHNSKKPESSDGRPYELLKWSAKSAQSREQYGTALAKNIAGKSDNELHDISYTLNACKTDFNYRRFIVAASIDEVSASISLNANAIQLKEAPGEVVFTFPGQGAQYLNMAADLYHNEVVYREAVDTCAEMLQDYISTDIRTIVFQAESSEEAMELLKQTRYTQPALFVTEYALARLWMHWGIIPSLLCGHSIGEYVAAQLSGIFSLKDALKLIATRGSMVNDLPSGSMLSVREAASILIDMLTENLSIAAINSPKLCVVAGPDEDIDLFIKLLDNKEIANKRLSTSHAFHSSMMDPIVSDFQKVVSEVILSTPQIPILSTVTGQVLRDEEATNPAYWAQHLRKTVCFSDAIKTILEYHNPIFLEVGPGTVNTILIKQIAAEKGVQVRSTSSLNAKENGYKSILTALGWLWNYGLEPNWNNYYADQQRLPVDVPTYQFDKKRYWIAPVVQEKHPVSILNEPILPTESANNMMNDFILNSDKLKSRVQQVLADASGIEINAGDSTRNFYEIGLDSLLLTQIAISLKKEFGLPITFRKLNEEYATVDALTAYIEKNLPGDHVLRQNFTPVPLLQSSVSDTSLDVIVRQLELLTKQVQSLSGGEKFQKSAQPEENEISKPFGATPKIERKAIEVGTEQIHFIKDLTKRYNKKTSQSKKYAEESRSYMADPRVVSGFKPLTKELVYPIVINKSSGSRMWDLDGNEYIDVLNGFGSNMLGYQPEVIKKAMHEQIEKGYEVGPQHELAAEVSKLICDFTGFERSALCSTGSEAVLGCIRIARTVTGRSLIVAFSGSYHGIIDEVLVRGTKKLKSFPAAAGIMPEAVQNILVLDYGTTEALEIIKQRAEEIAAVIVEPVQSRRPEFVPIDFVKNVREITAAAGAILVFDEVITGFRMHPGGAQALFDVRADLASYGKVIGGGVPIGAIAGKKEYMDALDGGNWNYGDQSFPETGVTYFAGTFVRHPLALASAKASLTYMKERGPALQQELNEKGKYISTALNNEIAKRQLPFFIANYGSLWKVKFEKGLLYEELLFTLMREKGIHILDGFPCFMTEAISKEDIEEIISCFIESVEEMTTAGFFKSKSLPADQSEAEEVTVVADASQPPVKGARLGKDQSGNPAWFIKDPEQEGKFLKIDIG